MSVWPCVDLAAALGRKVLLEPQIKYMPSRSPVIVQSMYTTLSKRMHQYHRELINLAILREWEVDVCIMFQLNIYATKQ